MGWNSADRREASGEADEGISAVDSYSLITSSAAIIFRDASSQPNKKATACSEGTTQNRSRSSEDSLLHIDRLRAGQQFSFWPVLTT